VASKHTKTLEAIFKEPTPANVRWDAAIAALKSLGAEVTESSGSITRIKLKGVRSVFHRPHPRNEMGRGRVRAMRTFLENAGFECGPRD
jgi:hypothetical protein